MSNSHENIVAMVLMLALIVLVGLTITNDQPTEQDMYQWAVTECEQGNPDACQLERNLLKR